jgi:hypothetical protein
MADKVSLQIERLKMEFIYFIKKGVFSKEEAREIIK